MNISLVIARTIKKVPIYMFNMKSYLRSQLNDKQRENKYGNFLMLLCQKKQFSFEFHKHCEKVNTHHINN